MNKKQKDLPEVEAKKMIEEEQAKVNAQFDLNSLLISIIARREATNIVVDILNNFFDVRQKQENKFNDEELKAIQGAITQVEKDTNDLLTKFNEIVKGQMADAKKSSK